MIRLVAIVLATVLATVPASAQVTIDRSPATQANREGLIEKLVRERVFQKVEVPGNLPRVWVMPRFDRISFETKEKFLAVVYAYYFDGSNKTDLVRIFDGRTGKEVGQYSLSGLKIF